MSSPSRRPRRHTVIVVGSRVAGAATAMLLARRGHRVLLLDRRRPGSDTLSTHALMRGGVLQLSRWGVLERVIASGAPPISRTVVHYGDEAEWIDLKVRAGVGVLYAPRRSVLDAILADAAAESGVEVRYGVTVSGLLKTSTGRVCGVAGRDASGRAFSERARFVVGADGLQSLVARAAGAPVTRRGRGATGLVYGYVPGLPDDRYEWFYRPGVAGGIVPTNGGEACVWVGAPAPRFMASLRFDLERAFRTLLEEAAPEAAERVLRSGASQRLLAFRGVTGFLRRPWGEGWALVGDASHFKDPISAHGMTDALRDAELLATALDSAITGASSESEALGAYEKLRDRLTEELFETTDEVALFGWDLPRLRELLIRLSRAMKLEVEALAALDGVKTTAAA
jgi:2-polyprenyl-6-methoxyphenol hydroxylase-like FAD-dependent oxidoreductase